MSQIISKLEKPSKTVESQTAHILSLKKKIKNLYTHLEKNIDTIKANKVAIKKIEIMANWTAIMVSITLPMSSSLSPINTLKNIQKPAQNSYSSPYTTNKGNLSLILDLV